MEHDSYVHYGRGHYNILIMSMVMTTELIMLMILTTYLILSAILTCNRIVILHTEVCRINTIADRRAKGGDITQAGMVPLKSPGASPLRQVGVVYWVLHVPRL